MGNQACNIWLVNSPSLVRLHTYNRHLIWKECLDRWYVACFEKNIINSKSIQYYLKYRAQQGCYCYSNNVFFVKEVQATIYCIVTDTKGLFCLLMAPSSCIEQLNILGHNSINQASVLFTKVFSQYIKTKKTAFHLLVSVLIASPKICKFTITQIKNTKFLKDPTYAIFLKEWDPMISNMTIAHGMCQMVPLIPDNMTKHNGFPWPPFLH